MNQSRFMKGENLKIALEAANLCSRPELRRERVSVSKGALLRQNDSQSGRDAAPSSGCYCKILQFIKPF